MDREGDESSEIDEDDPLAAQLRSIKQNKKIQKIDAKYDPYIEKATKWSPFLFIFERYGKMIVIACVLIYLVYSASEKNKEAQAYGFFSFLGNAFNKTALEDISWHMGLYVFALGGFFVLSYYNNKADRKINEDKQKRFKEAAEAKKED